MQARGRDSHLPMTEPCNTERPDLFCGSRGLLIWCLPAAILVATALSNSPYRVLIWPIALTWMGGACLVNAKRCGRRHCYVTGPFFLALAIASLLYGLGILSLGPRGWQILSAILLVGSVALTCLPEWIWGRYVARKSPRKPMEESR
jgi:hypothetical protein